MVRLNALAVACFLSIGSIALAAPPPPVPSQAAAPLVSVLIASDEASTKIETSAIAKSIVVTSPPAPPNGATPAKKLHADLVFDTSKERIDVRKRVELLQALANVDAAKKRPPITTFTWGATSAVFAGVVASTGVRYTMFLDDGTPVRATVSLHMHEAPRCTNDASCPRPMVCSAGYCAHGPARD